MSDAIPTAAGVFAGASSGLGGLVGGILGHEGGNIMDMFSPPKQPELKGPNALSSTPTRAEASRVAARKTLDNEAAFASTGSLLTGGAGLLDEPATTSRTLLAGA
jgi:hypothetical protein